MVAAACRGPAGILSESRVAAERNYSSWPTCLLCELCNQLAAHIGTHLVDAVAIAVQRCTGMALQRSQWLERQVAMGA